jgi:hypothetical protein
MLLLLVGVLMFLASFEPYFRFVTHINGPFYALNYHFLGYNTSWKMKIT